MKLADMYFYLPNDSNKEIDNVIVFVEPGKSHEEATERASDAFSYGCYCSEVIRNIEIPDEAEYNRPYIG